MSKLVQTYPVILFYFKCYHYEIRMVIYNLTRKGGGKKGGKRKGRAHGIRTEKRKVTTWRVKKIFLIRKFQMKNQI